jgi:hypothetical protein
VTWRNRHRDPDKWAPLIVVACLLAFGYLLAVSVRHLLELWAAR